MKKILIIDDRDSVRMSFKLTLDDYGYQVQTAVNGREAINILSRSFPDMIFLDLDLSDEKKGIQALRDIRNFGYRGPVRIITAYGDDFMSQIDLATREGLDFEVSTKPINSGDILKIIQMTFGSNSVHNEKEIPDAPDLRGSLTLYVNSPDQTFLNSVEALQLKISEKLPNLSKINIIDIKKYPERIESDEIILTPVLIRKNPGVVCQIFGRFENYQYIIRRLAEVYD